MQVPVQVLSSRHYSFAGNDGKQVNIVEAMCLVKHNGQQVVGKVNTRGLQALEPGNYTATLRVSEREGKLAFSLGDFVGTAQAYAAAAAK